MYFVPQIPTGGPCGATVARLTPDQKVACSNHVGVNQFLFLHFFLHLYIKGRDPSVNFYRVPFSFNFVCDTPIKHARIERLTTFLILSLSLEVQ